MWNAAAAIGAGFGLIAIVAVVISIGQYRGIMRPLRAMRDGVRRIASGQFQQRLPVVGEREFVELTEDFNRMAAELIALNDEDLTVFGDEAEIRQVLLNLCVNALEAVDPLTGVVRIVARRVNDDTEVDVEDNGCGMPPHVLQHLFEPFFSARRGEGRGTGLGLSITRAIMENLGGTIHADSAGPGRGSTFTVRFPGAMESVEA